MKLLPIFILSFFCTINLEAQESFEIPVYAKPVSKQDSIIMKRDVVESTKWIEETDLNKDIIKRKKINAFVLQWYIDNISLNMSLVEKLSDMNEGNSDLLLVFFAGSSRYYIENEISNTKFAATKAGLTSVMNVYKKGIGVTKSEELENLINLTTGKLDKYIEDNFDKD